jgi:hypothetical protein
MSVQQVTAEAIVDLIRHQNWKNGGVHSIDRDECITLLKNFAAAEASQARIEATETAYERAMGAFDRAVAPRDTEDAGS